MFLVYCVGLSGCGAIDTPLLILLSSIMNIYRYHFKVNIYNVILIIIYIFFGEHQNNSGTVGCFHYTIILYKVKFCGLNSAHQLVLRTF